MAEPTAPPSPAPSVAPGPAPTPRASPFSSHAFIIGCARSGTTWTQLLVAQHPRVCTSQENHLFSRYLGELVSTYDADARRERPRGIARFVPREELLALCAGVADGVFARLAGGAGAADVLLQKIPDVGGDASLVLSLFPQAKFVHVVRDPRAVVASLRGASKGWGEAWAPHGAGRGARLWRDAVTAARSVREQTDRYLEVRYEALHADTPGELARILSFLGLAADEAHCRRAAEACRFDDLKARKAQLRAPWDVNRQSDGFFRKGVPDGWREELSRTDLRLVEAVAWDLMRTLGYEPVHARRPRVTFSAWAHRKLRHLARQAHRATGRVAQWLDDRTP